MAALFEIDVRDILPTIRVPTLILHRTGDLIAPVEGARLMAEKIPDARLVEFEGTTMSRSPATSSRSWTRWRSS